MKIHFSKINTPLMILDGNDHAVGSINQTYKAARCPTCGGELRTKLRITGYSIQVYGRYWGQGRVLRPKGQGGASGVHMPTLKAAKALVIDRLEN